jgi:hypothetical protein
VVAYRCYVLDDGDHIVQAQDLECDTDDLAIAAGRLVLAQNPYYRTVEVWRATRRVGRLDRDPIERVSLVGTVWQSGPGLEPPA